MRPVGALLFGLLADRYGRRIPLMANVIYFSIIEVLCGFSPNFTVFIILRALFGIGMGGRMAASARPSPWRQRRFAGEVCSAESCKAAISIGYLLAAIAARFLLPAWGWRPMFWIGALPALLALYIRTKVPESEAWKQHRRRQHGPGSPRCRWRVEAFRYLVVLMTFMMFLSPRNARPLSRLRSRKRTRFLSAPWLYNRP